MKNLYSYLASAGVLPFVFCAILLITDVQQLPLLGSVQTIFSVYTLVILSFLAGAHWGQHLHIQGPWNRALAILSNIVAVFLWFGFLILSFKFLIVMFVSAFVILLLIDHRLYKIDMITFQYFQTRFIISTIVIISLLVSGIAS